MAETDLKFARSIPEIYDAYFVPMIFETCATDIAKRVAGLSPKAVLETAAGSGAVTAYPERFGLTFSRLRAE